MKFYAYVPTADGDEPTGCSKRIIRTDLRSPDYFVRVARKALGNNVRCFAFTNFYDNDTFYEIN